MSNRDKVLDYIKIILEVPRDEYSGMSACPFAKKERETDNIFIDTINNDSSFMECMDKFIKTDKNSAVFIQEGDIDMPEEYTKPYQKFLNSLLKENIEIALKRFKKKFRKTQIIKKLRANQYFEKKSTKKRHQIQKAIYKNIKSESYE